MRREGCNIRKLGCNKIRIAIQVQNMSNYPVHNIKLSMANTNNNDGLREYNEENFYLWMTDIAKSTDLNNSCEDIDFVASLSENFERKRTTIKNGQREERILESGSDAMTFYINCDFVENTDYVLPVEFLMQNINGKLYKQSTDLFILKKPDDSLYMFNHATKIEIVTQSPPELAQFTLRLLLKLPRL